MKSNPHFEAAHSWKEAESMLLFHPLQPKRTYGHRLQSLQIHVRDQKLREIPFADRTLETHDEAFVVTEVRKGIAETEHSALAFRYGSDPRSTQIAGHAARVYELGPEPHFDDIDGRSPSVVTWHDGEMRAYRVVTHTY
ncbi:MAG: hypothetical protein L0Y43_11420 [Methylococcaceae bacterium]|nr:hypothetical protein [Methylococcaceae bacterium]